MKQHSEFNSEEQHQEAGHQTQPSAALEFHSVEAMLRHDAIHTPVPPNIENRLQKSLGQTPPPSRAWWRRWFGGGGA
jgi:hypothetical protein